MLKIFGTFKCLRIFASVNHLSSPGQDGKVGKRIMKTQINNLRSGVKNQILNPNVDYNKLPQATSHIGHGGTNSEITSAVWEKVKFENPTAMTVIVKGIKFELTANWSGSGKSVTYSADVPAEMLKNVFHINPSRTNVATISIQSATTIMVQNGKNSYIQVCPSLVEIL